MCCDFESPLDALRCRLRSDNPGKNKPPQHYLKFRGGNQWPPPADLGGQLQVGDELVETLAGVSHARVDAALELLEPQLRAPPKRAVQQVTWTLQARGEGR